MRAERNGLSDEEKLHLAIRQEMSGQPSNMPGMLKLWSGPAPHQAMQLKEVVAIIRPQRWHHTKLRVQRLRVQAFIQMRVLGRGRERGLRYLPRNGAAHGTGIRYLPKRMISWIVEEAQVAPLVSAIIESNHTGQLGDGKIFILPVEGAVRVRTGERGLDAIQAQQPFELVMGTAQQPSDPQVPTHASR